MGLTKLLVLLLFIGILVSLGSGMVYLVRDSGKDSKRVVKALTWRIGLSIALFIILLLAWANGLIEPHGLMPNR